MRRTTLLALLALLAAALVVPAGAAVAQPAGSAAAAASAGADFDNDGFADLAVGIPGENDFAGAVNVLYGSGAGIISAGAQVFTGVGGGPVVGSFGSALAAGDFDNDGAADLAAGAPGETVGGVPQAGAVSVLRGSGGGLTSAGGRLFTQVAGMAEEFDLFGIALASGDLDGDGFADLVAGAPWERVGTVALAGTLSVIRGSAGGLTAGGHRINQVGGTVEVDDQFGAEVATGDFDNDGITDLAAGAPAEDVGSIFNAGAVSAGALLFTQNSPGIPGVAEDFDSFGGNAFNAG